MSKSYKNLINLNGKQKVLITVNHEQEAAKQNHSKVVDSVHHIEIFDRSGSMYASIDRLMENAKQTVEAMHEDDYISFVWFSGEGQCKSLLKGGRKGGSINKLLDSIKSTVGLTCFSTPMKEINEIINEYKDITPNFSVTLFTDGEPVVPWSIKEEERKIFEQLELMKDKILAFNTVGYGWYYNQDLLSRMSAMSMFGTSIHSNKIDEYLSIFNHNYEAISDLLVETVDISAPTNVEIVYLNTNSTKYAAAGKFKLTRLEKRKNQFFMLADADFDFELNGEKISTANITASVQQNTLDNFYYSYAYEALNTGRRKIALQILNNDIHDKALIDKLLNVFTYDEVESVKKLFRKATVKPAARFIDGKSIVGYLPREDQLCVMDILFALSEGENQYVVSKNYNRIGLQVVDEFNLFEKAEGEVICPFKTLVYNKKQLNVSILTKALGLIKLNAKEAKEHNLPKKVDGHIFRNYTIIKDGNLNMETITTIIDDATYQLITQKEHEFNVQFLTMISLLDGGLRRVELNLAALPVINASYANEGNNIESVHSAVEKMTNLEIKQKVLNNYIKEIKSNNVLAGAVGKFGDYTTEQIEVLKRHGLASDFTYNAIDPQKKEAVDYYEARSISFVFDGMSTVPKVSEALERYADPKKWAKANNQTKIMIAYINDLTARLAALNLSLEDNSIPTKEFLDKEQELVKTELKAERAKIHILKMAKVLTGDWFEGIEVNDKGEQTFTKNGLTLIAKRERIKIDI